jgi:hypothetical protein
MPSRLALTSPSSSASPQTSPMHTHHRHHLKHLLRAPDHIHNDDLISGECQMNATLNFCMHLRATFSTRRVLEKSHPNEHNTKLLYASVTVSDLFSSLSPGEISPHLRTVRISTTTWLQVTCAAKLPTAINVAWQLPFHLGVYPCETEAPI